MGIVDFAASQGAPLHLLSWYQHSPSTTTLRVGAAGDLYTLTPNETGGWRCNACGVTERAGTVDLRGLIPAEARGRRLTVWYEEERSQKVVDVPYTGVVLAVHVRDGLSVQFDHTLTAEGEPELLVISNEDDWMWGVHHNKAGGRAQVAEAAV